MNLSAQLVSHEALIRLGCFFGVFAAMALWEVLAPRRTLTLPKWLRWSNNLGLVFFNTLLLRLVFPAAAVGMALFAEARGWGLLNYYPLPAPLELLVSVVFMDLVIYLQHVMVHAVPLLWRLHRVHHADLDYDVTTGMRFHPIEILLSMLLKFAVIAVLGPPVAGVILFEVLLSSMSLFNHANVRLPLGLDRILRWLVVTPDMHRVHHSVEDNEANSNFGFNLSLWDRLFGTYLDQPREGHRAMHIGIRGYRRPAQVTWLPGLLSLPFIGRVEGYAINRRAWGQNHSEDERP